MAALLAVFAVFFVLAPLVFSLTICAPKWYCTKVRPQFERIPILGVDVADLEPSVGPASTLVDWISRLGALIFGPFILTFMVIVVYVSSIKNLIKWKCPYTPTQSYDEAVNRYHDLTWSDLGDATRTWWNYVIKGE